MFQKSGVCAVFGHRKIAETEQLKVAAEKAFETLFVQGVDTVLFGSKSAFDSMCWEVVTALKSKYPHIRRVCVSAYVQSGDYEKHLLDFYEEVLFPAKLKNVGANVYAVRNRIMIDSADICVFYFDKNYKPQANKSVRGIVARATHSGTRSAFLYALQKKKKVINLFESVLS